MAASIADILLSQGQQAAESRQRQGSLNAALVGNLGGLTAESLQQYGAQRQAKLRSQKIYDALTNPNTTPQDLIGQFGPEDGMQLLKAFHEASELNNGTRKAAQDAFPALAQAYASLDDAHKAAAYPEFRSLILKGGLPESALPKDYQPGAIEGALTPPAKAGEDYTLGPGMQRRNAKNEVVASVPASPRATAQPTEASLAADAADLTSPTHLQSAAALKTLKPAPEAKTYPVTVRGPDGRPMRKLVTAQEMAGGVPEYEKPADAPFGALGAPGADPNLTGEAFLQTLPTPLANEVKAYATGRRPFPVGRSLKDMEPLLQMVGQYDPSFDAANYNGRNKARQDFTAGTSAKQINALNTVVGHLADLAGKSDALGNTFSPTYNSLKNWVKTETGSSDVTNFNTVKKGVTDELTRTWRQAGGTEADIKSWADSLGAAQSPEQLTGAFSTIAGMLESKLSAMENQKQQGLGPFGDDIHVITPKARAALDKLQGISAPTGFTVQARGRTFTFQSQADADAFKADAGIK